VSGGQRRGVAWLAGKTENCHKPHTTNLVGTDERQPLAPSLDPNKKSVGIPILKMCYIRLTPLVRHRVVFAPPRRNPPEVATRILSLRVVAHCEREERRKIEKVGGCYVESEQNWRPG
jgi:hypothetical protein